MLYQEHTPHPALRSYIRSYWTLAFSASAACDGGQRFLAEGLELTFNLADPIVLVAGGSEPATARRGCVSGPMTEPMEMRPIGRVKILGVCFRPGGAYPFFPAPARELLNRRLEVEDLWGAKGSRIAGRIQDGSRTMRDRLYLLERHFLGHIGGRRSDDAALAAALRLIDEHRGQVRIDRVARAVGLSSRQLERRFQERVGLSPKQLCRSLRFKSVFRHLAAFPADPWTSTALACGYCDQSHLTRDFKRFTGTSPAAYFAGPEAVGRFFTGNF